MGLTATPTPQTIGFFQGNVVQDYSHEKAVTFTADQRQWLDAIKHPIAQSLAIEQADVDEVPFNRMGGLGKVYQLFGDRLPKLLDELNDRLAA